MTRGSESFWRGLSRGTSLRIVAIVALVLVGAAAVTQGCSSNDEVPVLGGQPGDGSTVQQQDPCASGKPEPGCSCAVAGATGDCGKVIQENGNYVTCSMGTTVCTDGTWGSCEGNRVVMKSKPEQALTPSGISIAANSVPCTNLCDPNGCQSSQGTPSDIDSSAIEISDGGISILPTIYNPDSSSDGAGSACTGLQCQLVNCPDGGTTTVTGTVYDPAGQNPLYNAYVYIPLNPDAGLPAFTTGPTCDTCAGVSINAIATAQTGPDGTFTLTGVPVGSNIPLVIQMGKWRRETTLPAITACSNTPLTIANTRLPQTQFDGNNNQADIPKMAFASGSADPFGCFLLRTGISPSEFGSTTSNSTKRILYFNGSSSPGASLSANYGNVVKADNTTNGIYYSSTELANYDVVLLACEGGEYDKSSTAPNAYTNMINYADTGGRLFATHFGYVWPLYSQWVATGPWFAKYHNTIDTQDPLAATINTGFPKGVAFAQWLSIVGASPTTYGVVNIDEARQDLGQVTAANYPNTQPWMSATDQSNSNSVFTPTLTFNTPYPGTADAGADAGPGTCGRAVFTDFHVSSADTTPGGGCASNNDCGYMGTCTSTTVGSCAAEACGSAADCADPSGVTCVGASPGTCTTETCGQVSDCQDPAGVTCNGGSLGTCTTETCYVASQCQDPSGVTCSGSYGTCGQKACSTNDQCPSGTCSGGLCTCSNNNQCRGTTSSTNGTCSSSTHTCVPEPCSTTGTCGTSEQCNGRALGSCTKTCGTSADCFSGETCVGGVCTGCENSNQCPGASTVCSGGTTGACKKTCATGADCYSGESCVGGVCSGCTNSNQCPGSTSSCAGITYGSCKKTCSTSADCYGTEQCVSGSCTGCVQSSDCPSGSCNGGALGYCSYPAGANTSQFPYACRQGPLTAQEKALEFLFFDLTACVSPDNLPPPGPPPPVTVDLPVTFTVDFTSSCPTGTYVQWREFDWQATIPITDAATQPNIVFSAQTTTPNDAGVDNWTGVQIANLATATTTTPNIASGNFDYAYIDTGQVGTGAFNKAVPPIVSQQDLQITITLNPSSDQLSSPTLNAWKVQYDCPPSE